LLQKDKKKWKQPTHKTAHLQIAQADTQPKFAKELFSCRRTPTDRNLNCKLHNFKTKNRFYKI